MPDAPIICFGEILWDHLPGGRFPGGAPLNVACHLARLGRGAALISAVGPDESGDEILQAAKNAGVDTTLIGRVQGVPTGQARATVDAAGQAVFEISVPAAWDFIPAGGAARAAVAQAPAFIFGSLAARSPASRTALEDLLKVAGPLKVMDVNLRAPYDDRARVFALARRAHVVKMNEAELLRLAGWSLLPEDDPRPLLEPLRDATGVNRWCVTLGAKGAWWWDGSHLLRAESPPVSVRDTVGAGDAFVAALVDGLTRGDPKNGPEKIQAILARACRLGALVAGREGACPDYTLQEIE